jgi:peptide deformylase
MVEKNKEKIDIVQRDNPVLRQKALDFDFKQIPRKELKAILKKMTMGLNSQDDGVAIAAPQIGVSLRMFLVSNRVFEMIKKHEGLGDKIFINPRIVKLSKEKKMSEEGCLSVRWLYGKVNRSIKATVEAYDENGKKFTMGASGLLAQVFQHEVDHLDGILFIDKAKDLEEIPPETNSSLDLDHE